MENEKKSGRGGYRPGAGRKPGSKNKKSAVAGLAKSRSVTLSAGEWEELEKLAEEHGWDAVNQAVELAYCNDCETIGKRD